MVTALVEHKFESLHKPPSIRHLSYCGDCGRLSEDHALNCDRCSGDDLGPISRVGEIYSYTIVHECDGSFVLGLIQLATGQLVMGRIVHAGRVTIGMSVELETEMSLSSPTGGVYFSPLVAGKLALSAAG